MLDNISTLHREGFLYIIALKDLRGDYKGLDDKYHAYKPQDAPMAILRDRSIFRNTIIPVKSIIAIMEIETWFLAESSHFERINSKLTKAFITSNITHLRDNPFTDNFENIQEPADLLNDIYQLVGLNYSKKKQVREKTIDRLDMAEIYFQLPNSVSSLKSLIEAIDSFL